MPIRRASRKENDEEEGEPSCQRGLEELVVKEGEGRVARRDEHEIAVGRFKREGRRGPDVHEELEEDDLKGGEGERGEEEKEEEGGLGAEVECEGFAEVGKEATPFPQGV